MSILPEYVIQQVLVHGIRAFRENSNLTEMLFRNLHQDDVNGIVEFLRDNSIDIAMNWPNAPISVPAIVITLKNETESQGFLGELLQPPLSVKSTSNPFPMDDLESPATILGGGSVEEVGLTTAGIGSPIRATGATSNTLTFSLVSPFNISDPFEVNNLVVVIREGSGRGQTREVSSITPNRSTNTVTVRVTTNWTVLPSSTSIFEFKTVDEIGTVGEPSKLFNSKSVVERLGAHYRVSYQLLISGPNQEMTLFLYAIVKALMIVNVDFLLKNGLINPKMSGTDFVAKPEYLPDFAYSRALILEFEHSFDVYIELEAINHIKLDLGVYDPNIGDSSGVERVVSSVDFDL